MDNNSKNTAADKPTLLVVGAGGFIGGFIVEEGLRRGYEVYAAVRESTSRRYLTDSRIHFVVLDYDDADALETALGEALPKARRWNSIIYNLGATKCARFADFNRINYGYLRDFTEAIYRLGAVPGHFLFMSSLSALGPVDEKNYTPIDSKAVPNPNTRYGLSKIKAETFLSTQNWLPWTIFRPTGVYGPREQDYLMMVKSIDRHFDFGVGYRRQMLTFIYVDDLVAAMFDAIASPDTIHKRYIISEPAAYTQSQFRTMVSKALGRSWVVPVKLPLWTAYVASVVAEKVAALTLKPSTLNRDKFKIMRQRNWNCSVADAQADFGFSPKVNLEEGVRRTVEAYIAAKKAAAEAKKTVKA